MMVAKCCTDLSLLLLPLQLLWMLKAPLAPLSRQHILPNSMYIYIYTHIHRKIHTHTHI